MGISPQQWQRVKELYKIAVECGPSERAALLRQSSDDEVVQRELKRLLDTNLVPDGFLSTPAFINPLQITGQGEEGLRSTAVGQILGHYRVREKIAAGGMGVVYRAHDELLNRDVALKVLPVGTIANEDSRRRFRQEALALAKLNHPNIETIHEFGSQDGTDYLCMELIAGQPLTEKLRTGPLEEHEILRLATQLMEGLAAAHEHSIVHRDLKPGNLMVMPDGRLKILDFGLAKLLEPTVSTELAESTWVETDKFAGTIPYMSPEQLRGRQLDQRSDIFSAGAVLYEMATGCRPFPQSQNTEVIGAILHKNPEPPSTLNVEISPGMESVICKALEKDPERRYHTARELKAALEGISATSQRLLPAASPSKSPASEVIQPQRNATRYILWATFAGTLALLIGILAIGTNLRGIRARLLGFRTTPRPPEQIVAPSEPRKSVAVIRIKNVSGRRDQDWQTTALAEMLTTQLAAGEQLRTISGEDVAQAEANLALPDADSYSRETLQKIHKSLNVDFVVLGTWISLPDGQSRVDVRLQDAVRGTTVASTSRKSRDLDALVTELGADLREKIGVGTISLAESAQAKASMPSSQAAIKLYAEGLAKLRIGDNMVARDLLQKAVLAEPNSAVVHSALAEAYTALGYDEKARQSARNAFDLSSMLSREDKLLIEARYREANKEWESSINNYRTLFGFFPDKPEYGILLANSQISGGRGKEALATVEQLRGSNLPFHEDPHIDLTAADALFALGNFKESFQMARAAEAKAQTHGLNMIRARALLMQAQALESLTELEPAKSAAIQSQRLYHTAGDRRGEQATLEVQAHILADQGDLSAALGKYRQQLAMTREIGNRHAEASAMNNMALVLNQQNNAVEAKSMWERALVGFHDVSDKNDSAQVQINLAGISLDEGDLVTAKKIYEEALRNFEEVNDQSGVASATAGIGTVFYAMGDCVQAKTKLEEAIKLDLAGGRQGPPADKLVSLADVLQLQGDLKGARQLYQDSLVDAQKNADKSNAAYALFGLGELSVYAADFKQARSNFDQALASRTELGEKENIASTQLAIGQLDFEQGDLDSAVRLAGSARETFRELHKKNEEIASSAVLIRTYLAQGNADLAEGIRVATAEDAAKTQSLPVKLSFAIASAGVESAKGKGTAVVTLKAVQTRARKAGLPRLELEAGLALAQITPKNARNKEYLSRLEKVQKDSAEKGFSLIAKKAASLKDG
jgi:serine/threonine protein kinase/tetratricopeptide (TPR) repeat protein